jgi:hypothetical protein
MDESFVFEQSTRTIKQENEFYTLIGLEDYKDNSNNPRVNNDNDTKILAKKIVREDNTVRFSIKLGSNGKMYNPVSIYGEEKTSNFLDRICRNTNKFRDVNAKAFDLYIKFLKTKNTAWLNNAEREME